MAPTPSAEGWDRLTDAWPERCDEIARGVRYREDVPVRDLFETGLDHMLPPPSMFDACDRRGVKADEAERGECPGTPGEWVVRPQSRPTLDGGELVSVTFKMTKAQRDALDRRAESRGEPGASSCVRP